MRLYSYILKLDYGFAPNPFRGYCTLANCKAEIRRCSSIGDWILGIGSNEKGSIVKGKLLYAMQVQEKLTYDQYWEDSRFKCKKPLLNGSKSQHYGDNIYHRNHDTGDFIQENSHHSKDYGETNYYNLNRDTSGIFVLISEKYWYFGKDAIVIPPEINKLVSVGRGYKKNTDQKFIAKVEEWLETLPDSGYIGEPIKLRGKFERHSGRV